MLSTNTKKKFLLWPLAAFWAAFLLIPLVGLLHVSLNSKGDVTNYVQIVGSDVFWRVILNTMIIAIVTASVTLLLAFPLAYIIARKIPTGATIYIAIITLPLWMSILVRSFAWIVLLQKEGMVNKLLLTLGMKNRELLYNRFSVILAMVYVFIPYASFILYSNFRKAKTTYVQVGASLGANAREKFMMIFLPQVQQNVLFVFLYVFISSFGYFITPALLGGSRELTIACLIDIEMNQTLNWSKAATLSILTIVYILILSTIISQLFKRKKITSL